MNILMLKVKYRVQYYWREFWKLFGICAKCWTKMNMTPKGRWICPNIDCGKN